MTNGDRALKKADEPPTETSRQAQTNKDSEKQAQEGKAPTQEQRRTTTKKMSKYRLCVDLFNRQKIFLCF